jgi:cytochrome c
MPSQDGNVNKEELKAIALYLYDFYDQQKYLKEMQVKSAFDALPKGEKLIRKSGCLNCHDIDKAKVGPSFKMIARREPNPSSPFPPKNPPKNLYISHRLQDRCP